MSASIPVECVGGPMDGRVVIVEDPCVREVFFPLPIPIEQVPWKPPADLSAPCDAPVARYRLEMRQGGKLRLAYVGDRA